MDYNFKHRGENVNIFEPVAIMKPENISIFDHVIISEFAYINGGLGTYIGNHIHIAAHSCISGGGYCIMEDFSGIAAGVKLITGSALVDGTGLTSPTLPLKFQSVKRSFVILKKHALLFTNVVVHPGIVIGEGSIVGSGSIVTKDTEPWSIYMGSPARKIKERDRSGIIKMEQKVYEEQQIVPTDFTEIIRHIR